MRRPLAVLPLLLCAPALAWAQPLPRGMSFAPPVIEGPPAPRATTRYSVDAEVTALHAAATRESERRLPDRGSYPVDAEIMNLQAAAAREAERGVPDPGSYPARARLAAFLPKLTAEVRQEDSSNRVVGLQGSGEVDYLRLAPGRTVTVRATWELGHLLAAPGELQAADHAAARAKLRAEAVVRVTRLHFERQKARVALLLEPPTDPVLRAQAELEVERLGAEIDALTGGPATRSGR